VISRIESASTGTSLTFTLTSGVHLAARGNPGAALGA
jgi:hypothetical protein